MGRRPSEEQACGIVGLWDILWSVFSHVNLGKDLLVVGSREKEKGLKEFILQALSFIFS